MKARATELQGEAVRWLVRLPFLGANEMSLLLDTTRPRAIDLLGGLEDLGWAEWITSSSPELEPERLHFLTEASLAKLPETLCAGDAELQRSFPVGRREEQERLLRLETAVGLNRFGAQLVAAVRGDEEVELAELRSLPWRRQRASAWWPPEVEAYGCLRWGSWRAPFFVAWDRAGAPSFHRRKRVSAWYAFREGQHCWGRDDVPPILVVCPGDSEAKEWSQSVLMAGDRRKSHPLSVSLADVRSALDEGPLGSIWRRPDGTIRAYLCERLAWRPAEPQETIGLAANPKRSLESLTERTMPLREWARQAVTPHPKRQKQGIEQLAALSVETSAMGKRVLEWLGHHPLLSADDLSVILRVSSQLVHRLLDGLVERGLADSSDKRLKGEPVVVRRYFLTRIGLRLLAARDGVPPRRYSRHGVVASPSESKKGGGRLDTLLRQLDHTVGANRFFVRLIANGGNGKPRLIRWLSASESALSFTSGETKHWLRPDGAGDIHWEGKMRRLYLEWDRGTVGWPDMTEKLSIWARWFAKAQPNGTYTSTSPHLLIVTTNPAREKVICGVLNRVVKEACLTDSQCFTTTINLLDIQGAFGCVWRSPMSERRIAWQLGGV